MKLSSTDNNGYGAEIQSGYGLRENPKKTKKLADSSLSDKFCKQCGKGFQSWKALFGHMKCHSDKERVSSSLYEQQLVKDSQSDDETTTALNRRRRSKRTSNNSSFCVAEIEQEQEEVALCLMMLSRHVGHWGAFNSAAKSSDNGSVFLAAPSTAQNDGITDFEKLKSDCFVSGFFKSDTIEVSEVELGPSSKRKLENICKISNKKRKFECAICKRIFQTYQALGGHRASHKNKGCLALKPDISNENSIDIQFPTDPIADFKLIKSIRNENQRAEKHKIKVHECPICFKLFSSGQALGGHKRSHLIQKPVSEVGDLLDLNLPAPVEEQSNGHYGFEPWWGGCSHNQDGLVSVISN